MKDSGRATEIQPPIIKGFPAMRIIRLLATGRHYQEICDLCPGLDWPAINEAVHFRNHVLVPAQIAEGRTPREVAREFGFSPQNVLGIMRRVARDKELEEHWGGLPARIVAIIKRAWNCRNLAELRQTFPLPTEEELLAAKGIGKIALRELRKVLTIKAPEPRPTQNIPPVHITKANQIRGALWNTAPPRHAWEIAQFFHAIAESARALPPDQKSSTCVPCMAGPRGNWCLGIVEACRTVNPPEIQWICPLCGKGGIIKDSATLH